MAAPENNEFWKLRSKHGRDKIFETPDIFLESAYEYFSSCDANPWFKNEAVKSGFNAGSIIEVPTQRPYSLGGLCIFLGIDRQTFRNYETKESHKDFVGVFTHVREIIETNQLEGATVGAYNANIIGRLLGLVDKTENKITSNQSIIVTDQETANEMEKMKAKFNEE